MAYDANWDKVSLLMHFDGADNSTVFMNEVRRQLATAVGDAKISTTQSKFGGSSAYFDGTGDYLTIPNSSNYLLGNSDFTVEFWMRSNHTGTGYGAICGVWSDNQRSWMVYANAEGYGGGGIDFYYSTNGSTPLYETGYYSYQVSTWAHIAITRQSGTLRFFIDGQLVKTADVTATFYNSPHVFQIGDSGESTSEAFNGYLDEIRITLGVARYTANFTPQTAAFDYYDYPYWATTVLLMHFNGTNNSTTFIDECGRTITRYGDAKISTTQSKFGGASGYFDGSSDYLTSSSTSYSFGTGDFTIEAFVYLLTPDTPGSPSYNWDQVIFGSTDYTPDFSFFIVNGDNRNLALWDQTTQHTSTDKVPIGVFTHVAVSRSGTTLRLFIDGVCSYTGTCSASFVLSGTAYIGGHFGMNNRWFKGYLDELQIIQGYAKYTANFVPATAPYALPSPINLVEVNQELFTYLGDTTQKNILSDDNAYYRELTPYDDSGIWTVTGIVTIKSVPVQTTVYLFTKDDKRLIASTLSNSQGEYTISGLKNQSYFVWAEDPTATYNPITRLALNEVI